MLVKERLILKLVVRFLAAPGSYFGKKAPDEPGLAV